MPVRARVGLWFVDLDARRLDLDRILITALAGAAAVPVPPFNAIMQSTGQSLAGAVPSPCGWQLARSLIFAAG